MSSAARSPASVSRTASVTSAPARASARAVATPIPELAPVTMTRRLRRSMPSTTCSAVVRRGRGAGDPAPAGCEAQPREAHRRRHGVRDRREVATPAAAAPALLADHPPDVALRRWMDRFVGDAATKRGMGEALQAAMASDSDLHAEGYAVLNGALDELVGAAVAAGAVRGTLAETTCSARSAARG
jgi:hypothetical protein